MSHSQGVFMKLTIRGGTERDLAKLFGQDLIADLNAFEECKELMSTLADNMSSEVKDILSDCTQNLEKLSKTVSPAQKQLKELCVSMGLSSGSTRVAPSSGHAIVEKRWAPYLVQLLDHAQVKLGKNELLVSPESNSLVEELLDKRLEGKRQPKITDRERVHLSMQAHRSPILAEEEREAILKKFGFESEDGVKLGRTMKSKMGPFEQLKKAIFGIPCWSQLDSVSLISFESRETKSTGIGAKYKFKVKMVSIRKPKLGQDEDLEELMSSEPAGDANNIGNQCSDDLMAESQASFLLGLEQFKTFASHLQNIYGIAITGEELLDIFHNCCAPIAETVCSDAESLDSTSLDIEESLSEDKSRTVLQIIEGLGQADDLVGGLGNFQKYWANSTNSFTNDVVMPHLEAARISVKFEGAYIPKEVSHQIWSELCVVFQQCFQKHVLKRFFLDRSPSNEHWRLASKSALKVGLNQLQPSLKQRLDMDTSEPTEVTLDSLKQTLISLAKEALQDTFSSELLQSSWNNASKTHGIPKREQKEMEQKDFKWSRPPGARARDQRWQFFAPWLQPKLGQMTKRDKGQTFKIKQAR